MPKRKRGASALFKGESASEVKGESMLEGFAGASSPGVAAQEPQMPSMIDNMLSCVESFYPILYLVTADEGWGDDVVRDLAKSAEIDKIQEWNMACGCFIHERKIGSPQFETTNVLEDEDYQDLSTTLANWLAQPAPKNGCFFLIKDLHLALRDNPLAVARLKALAEKIVREDGMRATVFCLSSQRFVPPELDRFVTVFEPPPPDEKQIERIIVDHAEALAVDVEYEVTKRLAVAFRGLGEYEIRRLLNRGYQIDGAIDEDDVKLAKDEKAQIIKKGGILEMVEGLEGLDSIGGLGRLKSWLTDVAYVMHNLASARDFGVDTPKGIVIVGMPGCGKSLAAKATATLFDLPLLRLDVGSLMGRYVGESESNMRRALQMAEAVSPCVLWVDEVEKAFAGIGNAAGGSGSEVTSRLFGYFLTWMQEKAKPVFVVTTANDISSLPPELLRKGRFDEVFNVDLPTKEERKAILKVHLKKRGHGETSIGKLAEKTKGFSGADLEGVVQEAIRRAFVKKERLALDHLREAVEGTNPLAELMKKKLDGYRQKMKEMGVKNASEEDENASDKRSAMPAAWVAGAINRADH